jgi:hypothetical protein
LRVSRFNSVGFTKLYDLHLRLGLNEWTKDLLKR